MEPWQLVAIMMSLALASYIQTLTGFAFGLIVMGLLDWLWIRATHKRGNDFQEASA